MPSRPSSSASPIPESSSSFGDSIVPPQTTTSCSARTRSTAPSRTSSTPVQRPPSISSRVARASGEHREVRRVEHRPQERGRRALAHAVLDRQLAVRDAVERLGVVVLVERDARLLRRADDRLQHGMRLVLRQHVRRPAGAVERRRAAVEVLGALEQRQHVVERPARVAEIRPRVVVAAMAAHVDHPVERARAAEHPAARPAQLAAGARRLRHRLVVPVLRALPELEDARRIVDRRVLVHRAGLEEQDARARVDEPPRDDGSGRSGADNDYVVAVRHLSPPSP